MILIDLFYLLQTIQCAGSNTWHFTSRWGAFSIIVLIDCILKKYRKVWVWFNRVQQQDFVNTTLNPHEHSRRACISDSCVWYLMFQATEIEKARAIAHRALSTISFREEQEKLNVWCALLNLENLYGTKVRSCFVSNFYCLLKEHKLSSNMLYITVGQIGENVSNWCSLIIITVDFLCVVKLHNLCSWKRAVWLWTWIITC
jgi:hypothetical protein